MTKFNPEGSGYDYESAKKHGIKPETIKGKKKWQSRVPETGLLLKGKKHETWWKTERNAKAKGYLIKKKGDRYYSFEKRFKPKKFKKCGLLQHEGGVVPNKKGEFIAIGCGKIMGNRRTTTKIR